MGRKKGQTSSQVAVPKPDTLRAFSNEHLRYEIEMLAFAAGRIGHPWREGGDDPVSRANRNAMMECFTMHARALKAFLYEPRGHEDDAIAEDFFDQPDVWRRQRGALPQALALVSPRVGKEIAHLTYARLRVSPETKGWRPQPIARDLIAALKRFASGARADRLHPDCGRFILQLPSLE